MKDEEDIKTKFQTYVCFTDDTFDTTPDADDDSGVITIPVVSLDGHFTIDDIKIILQEFENRTSKKENVK